MPTLRQLTTDAEADLIEWLDDNPDADASAIATFIDETATEAVPVMTTTLFQMVVDDNSLAFIDAETDSSEPFTCLSAAIRSEIEKHLTKFIEDREQPE